MLRFVKKSHYKKGTHGRKLVITYSVSEIIIGALLVLLVAFYIYNYLMVNLYTQPQQLRMYFNNQLPLTGNQNTTPQKK